MKKIILTLTLMAALSVACLAQCNKNIVLNSSKTDHLDASGTIIRTDDEAVTIEISKSTVAINVNGENKMNGTIIDNTCEWKTPFKEGKSVIHANMTNGGGEDKKVTITIEGKSGKVTLLFEMAGQPGDRVKVAIDKFIEKA